jgi:hypothetical protein
MIPTLRIKISPAAKATIPCKFTANVIPLLVPQSGYCRMDDWKRRKEELIGQMCEF